MRRKKGIGFMLFALIGIITLGLISCKKEFNVYQVTEAKDTIVIIVKPQKQEIPTPGKDTAYVHKWKFGNGRKYPIVK